ncbi:MAG TPA: hypothetical protein VMM18_12960 [Gemmatimonadaceae bacterium]|nr:hypothetical protein [Gemmatimonadaceae bacterium]
MSTIRRQLAGPMLSFDLAREIENLRADSAYERTGRLGRTLAKSGRLRLVLVVLEAGVEVGTHHADSPLTLQPLEGLLRFRVGDEDHEIRAGQVLYFGAGDAQQIHAVERTALLLTLSMVEEGRSPGALAEL